MTDMGRAPESFSPAIVIPARSHGLRRWKGRLGDTVLAPPLLTEAGFGACVCRVKAEALNGSVRASRTRYVIVRVPATEKRNATGRYVVRSMATRLRDANEIQ